MGFSWYHVACKGDGLRKDTPEDFESFMTSSCRSFGSTVVCGHHFSLNYLLFKQVALFSPVCWSSTSNTG